jgi:hypothetical protein
MTSGRGSVAFQPGTFAPASAPSKITSGVDVPPLLDADDALLELLELLEPPPLALVLLLLLALLALEPPPAAPFEQAARSAIAVHFVIGTSYAHRCARLP